VSSNFSNFLHNHYHAVVASEAVSDAVEKHCSCLVPHVHTQGSARPSEIILSHQPFVSSSFPAFRSDPAHPCGDRGEFLTVSLFNHVFSVLQNQAEPSEPSSPKPSTSTQPAAFLIRVTPPLTQYDSNRKSLPTLPELRRSTRNRHHATISSIHT
jgi:hypothetical protein